MTFSAAERFDTTNYNWCSDFNSINVFHFISFGVRSTRFYARKIIH